jgi:hypothetical protein
MMQEGIDYCYIYPKDDMQTVQIRLLSGPYKDTIYKYGKVKFEEKDDGMHLLFAYDVIECDQHKPKVLEKDADFKNFIGNLLVEIMSGNIEQDIIDESGTNDPSESSL